MTHQNEVFHPAEIRFDLLALPDANLVTRMAIGAPINRCMFFLRHMRRYFAFSAVRHQGLDALVFVGTQGTSTRVCSASSIASALPVPLSYCLTNAGL
ncbi:MAG: hypothetical protein WAT12_17365 [Candidatus Nitrotoga sp.]